VANATRALRIFTPRFARHDDRVARAFFKAGRGVGTDLGIHAWALAQIWEIINTLGGVWGVGTDLGIHAWALAQIWEIIIFFGGIWGVGTDLGNVTDRWYRSDSKLGVGTDLNEMIERWYRSERNDRALVQI